MLSAWHCLDCTESIDGLLDLLVQPLEPPLVTSLRLQDDQLAVVAMPKLSGKRGGGKEIELKKKKKRIWLYW